MREARDACHPLKPYISGEDLTEPESKDRWLIDFNQMPLERAQQYRRPMQYVVEHVKPKRNVNRGVRSKVYWWLHQRNRPEMRAATAPLSRFIVTTIHATHRAFVWLTPDCIPNNALTVIAADDDFTFGVLNSRLHVRWEERLGTSLGGGQRLALQCHDDFRDLRISATHPGGPSSRPHAILSRPAASCGGNLIHSASRASTSA